MKQIKKSLLVLLLILCLILSVGCRETFTYEELQTMKNEIWAQSSNFEFPSFVGIGIEKDENDRWIIMVELLETCSQKNEIVQWLKEDYGDAVRIEFGESMNELF